MIIFQIRSLLTLIFVKDNGRKYIVHGSAISSKSPFQLRTQIAMLSRLKRSWSLNLPVTIKPHPIQIIMPLHQHKKNITHLFNHHYSDNLLKEYSQKFYGIWATKNGIFLEIDFQFNLSNSHQYHLKEIWFGTHFYWKRQCEIEVPLFSRE